jgi:hypothetical protein
MLYRFSGGIPQQECKMKSRGILLTALILVNLSLPAGLMAQQAQSHVVPLQELQNRLAAQSAQRSQDIQEIQKLLRHDLVQKQMGKLVDLSRVEAALPSVGDEALHQLAIASRSVNDDIEAGIATWGAVIIVLLLAITAIIVVAIVVVL